MSVKTDNYICLSAMLKARTNNLLSTDMAQRMANAASFEDCAKSLCELGYEDMSDYSLDMISKALENHKAEIFSEISNLCPDSEPVDLFKIKYDYHNVKALIKSDAMGIGCEHLLSNAGRIPANKLVNAYNEDSYHDFPAELSHAILNGKSLLHKTGNPQALDFELDKADFKELTDIAKALDNSFIISYVKALIDASNITTVTRVYKLDKASSLLKDAVIDGGTVSKSSVIVLSDFESVITLYRNGIFDACVDVAISVYNGENMTELEIAVDNAITAYMHNVAMINYGPEVVCWYLDAVESEITAIRMILSCKKAGVESKIILERLRTMYE